MHAPSQFLFDGLFAQEVKVTGCRARAACGFPPRSVQTQSAGFSRMKRQCKLCNRLRISSRKRRASVSCSKPTNGLKQRFANEISERRFFGWWRVRPVWDCSMRPCSIDPVLLIARSQEEPLLRFRQNHAGQGDDLRGGHDTVRRDFNISYSLASRLGDAAYTCPADFQWAQPRTSTRQDTAAKSWGVRQVHNSFMWSMFFSS